LFLPSGFLLLFFLGGSSDTTRFLEQPERTTFSERFVATKKEKGIFGSMHESESW
jgi:hypothetical protein